MVNRTQVQQQLKGLGLHFRFWCRAEIEELSNILFEGEKMQHVLVGYYEGGFALLCATDHRVLLIDKKPFYLTIEDIRYDMISDVQFNHRLINATVRLGTINKTIAFTSYTHVKLRAFTNYIQEQVMLYRQQHITQLQPDVAPLSTGSVFAPGQSSPDMSHLQLPRQVVVNPYSNNIPVMIRRRVSRFY